MSLAIQYGFGCRALENSSAGGGERHGGMWWVHLGVSLGLRPLCTHADDCSRKPYSADMAEEYILEGTLCHGDYLGATIGIHSSIPLRTFV